MSLVFLRYVILLNEVDIVQTICDAFNFTSEDIRSHNNIILRMSSDADILQYLHDKYQLTREDALTEEVQVLKRAICRSDINSMKCLFYTYGIRKTDIVIPSMFSFLSRIDSLDVWFCFKEDYGVTYEDIFLMYDSNPIFSVVFTIKIAYDKTPDAIDTEDGICPCCYLEPTNIMFKCRHTCCSECFPKLLCCPTCRGSIAQ